MMRGGVAWALALAVVPSALLTVIGGGAGAAPPAGGAGPSFWNRAAGVKAVPKGADGETARWFVTAVERTTQGRYVEAAAAYGLALAAGADAPAVYANLGEVLMADGQLAAAEACYRDAVAAASVRPPLRELGELPACQLPTWQRRERRWGAGLRRSARARAGSDARLSRARGGARSRRPDARRARDDATGAGARFHHLRAGGGGAPQLRSLLRSGGRRLLLRRPRPVGRRPARGGGGRLPRVPGPSTREPLGESGRGAPDRARPEVRARLADVAASPSAAPAPSTAGGAGRAWWPSERCCRRGARWRR